MGLLNSFYCHWSKILGNSAYDFKMAWGQVVKELLHLNDVHRDLRALVHIAVR